MGITERAQAIDDLKVGDFVHLKQNDQICQILASLGNGVFVLSRDLSYDEFGSILTATQLLIDKNAVVVAPDKVDALEKKLNNQED